MTQLFVLVYGPHYDDIMYFTCFDKALQKLRSQKNAIVYEYGMQDGVYFKTKHGWVFDEVDGDIKYVY
jgi:hypothetical protein